MLNTTVVMVPTREYVFTLTNANARTGKRDGRGGEADIKMLGAYDRDVLNENGKLLLGFTQDNKLALLNTLFCIHKSGLSYSFQNANRNKGKLRPNYILTNKVGRRLVRCINIHRPFLEAPELDLNLV